MKRMSYPIAGIIFFFGFLLQTTALWRVPVFGYSANLTLCLIVTFTNLYKREYALIYGMVFGILLDVTTQQYVGAQSISFLIIYLLIRYIGDIFDHEKVLPELAFSFGATLINGFMVWLIYKIGGSPIPITLMLVSLPPVVFLNGVTVFLLHILLVRSIIRHHRDRKFNGGSYL